MKDIHSLHLKVQELCDCFATTDPLKEMSVLGKDEDKDDSHNKKQHPDKCETISDHVNSRGCIGIGIDKQRCRGFIKDETAHCEKDKENKTCEDKKQGCDWKTHQYSPPGFRF